MTSRFGMRSDWSYHFDLEIKKIFTIFRFPCFRVYHFKPPYLNLRRSTVFVLVSDHSWTFMNVLIECWITGKLLKSSRMRNFRKFSNPLIFNFLQNHQNHQKIPKISLIDEKIGMMWSCWIYPEKSELGTLKVCLAAVPMVTISCWRQGIVGDFLMVTLSRLWAITYGWLTWEVYRCWWRMLATKYWRPMLVTDLIYWEDHQHSEKSLEHYDSTTNI